MPKGNTSIDLSKLLYYISPADYNIEEICSILKEHPEIKFVSLVGIDIAGQETDEKIPIHLFLEDINTLLSEGVQTDGSSVNLPKIATLNNARVDIIPDLSVKWFVDYNYDYIDEHTKLPVGTLRIPSFLVHDNTKVCSRSILQNAANYFKQKIMSLLKECPSSLECLGIDSISDIENIILSSATELEFWVKTPNDSADIEQLSTSQVLKEQYWKRTVGPVRTALEKSIMFLDRYGHEAEMGHKEVGGVKAKLQGKSNFNHIMEQLEVDWKYSTALQAADNELIARDIIKDIFMHNGLEVTFMAKPIEGVAGNGEHTHVSIFLKLKDGRLINLFSPLSPKNDFMNPIGFGALMGLLKNYEIINPFITSTNDALNRLTPGFEAPICIVSSIGHKTEIPSRNRTVLVGLVRDLENDLSTRFEVRSPNPTSNTYLVLASIYQTMLDGIEAAMKSNKSTSELLAELSKDTETEGFYLEKGRAYRSEYDVFEDFTEEERNTMFGKPPATVWENIDSLNKYTSKKATLLQGDVFTDKIIISYQEAILSQWLTELSNRIIPENIEFIRTCKRIGVNAYTVDLDVVRWEKISSIRTYLMKDKLSKKSLFTRIKEAIDSKDYATVSKLQLEMRQIMKELRELYLIYKKNLFELE